MPESRLHRRLVHALAQTLRERTEQKWLMFIDSTEMRGLGPPPFLAEVQPDIYARDESSGHVIIGEAKTSADIDNDHTYTQLGSYFAHLRDQLSGELILAVPLGSAGIAYRVCKAARLMCGHAEVPFQVAGWMFGASDYVRSWRG